MKRRRSSAPQLPPKWVRDYFGWPEVICESDKRRPALDLLRKRNRS